MQGLVKGQGIIHGACVRQYLVIDMQRFYTTQQGILIAGRHCNDAITDIARDSRQHRFVSTLVA